MAKKISLILTILLIIFSPMFAMAHGGVQKQAGNTTVYLSQNPISPLVGEEVSMTFVLKQGLNEPLTNLNVTLSVVDTFYGDATKDKTVLVEQKETDANGAFEFSYTFDKENYFDIDIKFNDPKTGEPQETGFLIQPRTTEIRYRNNRLAIFAAGIAGIIIGLGIFKLAKHHA